MGRRKCNITLEGQRRNALSKVTFNINRTVKFRCLAIGSHRMRCNKSNGIIKMRQYNRQATVRTGKVQRQANALHERVHAFVILVNGFSLIGRAINKRVFAKWQHTTRVQTKRITTTTVQTSKQETSGGESRIHTPQHCNILHSAKARTLWC